MTTIYDKYRPQSVKRNTNSGAALNGIDLATAQRSLVEDVNESARIVNNIMDVLYNFTGFTTGLGGLVRVADDRWSNGPALNFTSEIGIMPADVGIEGRNIYVYASQDDSTYSNPDFDTLHTIFWQEDGSSKRRPNTIYETFVELKQYTDALIDSINVQVENYITDNCITDCEYTMAYIGTVAFDVSASALGEVDSMVDQLNAALCRVDQLKDDLFGVTYTYRDHRVVDPCDGLRACTLESRVDELVTLHGGSFCATDVAHVFNSSDIVWDVAVALTDIGVGTEGLLDRVQSIGDLDDVLNRIRYEIARLRLGDTVTISNLDTDKWDTDITHTTDGSNMGVAFSVWTGAGQPFGTQYAGSTVPYSLDGHMGCVGTASPSASNPHGMHYNDLGGTLWSQGSGFIYPTNTATDDVVIGDTSQVSASNKFEVIGKFLIRGDASSVIDFEAQSALTSPGYSFTVTGSDGGAYSGATLGGRGGSVSYNAGEGGDGSGPGGIAYVKGGRGATGNSGVSSGTGGVGGDLSATAGTGGEPVSSATAGVGGDAIVRSGHGGDADGPTVTAGDGGASYFIAGGSGAATSGATGGTGGSSYVRAGSGNIADGNVVIGDSSTLAVYIGSDSISGPQFLKSDKSFRLQPDNDSLIAFAKDTVESAAGSTFDIIAGEGGDGVASSAAGGTGGYVRIFSGGGGDGSDTTSPGNGGAASYLGLYGGTGGTGGDTGAAGGDGGNGADVQIIAGDGGNATNTGGFSGDGGDIWIKAGSAGLDSGGASKGNNGDIYIGGDSTTTLYLGRDSSANVCNTETAGILTCKDDVYTEKAFVPKYIGYGTSVTISADATIIGVTANSVTLTLPDAAKAITGFMYIIVDESGNASGGNITINAATGNINGTTGVVISTDYGGYTIYSNGSNWFAY